ncbi:MAG: nucleoside monophosphate kinase [Candidatus Woesebacteria bacterium]|nr:nucleoside monophosphate kinase [Candidatus Woesebacteria bacterium]
MKKVILIYGAPGAGKGTQADLLSKKMGFYHFDTGKYIEQTINDPDNSKNKKFQKEKEIFDSGKLNTPSWVLKDVVIKNTKKFARAGIRIVFSGSPRTLFEAFGDDENKGLIEILEKLYGRENLGILYIDIKPESSIFRNSNRLVCSVCATPVLFQEGSGITVCPICSAPLKKRVFDNPEKLKVRLEEYKNRTYPILEELKKRGYKIDTIDGEPAPFKVFEEVKNKIS